ncbi:hypothetical protein PRIEUP_LOCUS344, partial [Pristimantis euphronides]
PGSTTSFFDQLTCWFLHFLCTDISTIIMGDFNSPVVLPHASKFLLLTSFFGLSQWSNSSTHNESTRWTSSLLTSVLYLTSKTHSHSSPTTTYSHSLLSYQKKTLPPPKKSRNLPSPPETKHLDSGTL